MHTAVVLNMFNNNRTKIFIFLLLILPCTNLNANQNASTHHIIPISFDAWTEHLSSYPPDIVVVDLWAMWCSSCLERFPEMVNLHNKYKDKGVSFISMNLDDRNDLESLQAAEQFVTSMNTQFEHFRMDENLIIAFEKLNLISIPAVFIYDQAGLEKYRLSGDNPNKQFTEHDIEEAIQSLIEIND